jgi:hypothetical protein
MGKNLKNVFKALCEVVAELFHNQLHRGWAEFELSRLCFWTSKKCVCYPKVEEVSALSTRLLLKGYPDDNGSADSQLLKHT